MLDEVHPRQSKTRFQQFHPKKAKCSREKKGGRRRTSGARVTVGVVVLRRASRALMEESRENTGGETKVSVS